MLVHGTTADHSRWAPVLPAFEQHFTVLAIDRRGRGRSGDAGTYALEREYEDVAAVVEWAGAEVDVLGSLVRWRLCGRGGAADRPDPTAGPLRAAAGHALVLSG